MSDPRLTKRSPKQIAGISLVWVLTVLVALMMFGPGLNKLTNGEGWGTRFANWGLPAALVPIVGIAEVGGRVAVPGAKVGALRRRNDRRHHGWGNVDAPLQR